MRSGDLSKPRDRIVILLFNPPVLGKPTSIINCLVLLTWVHSVFQSRINYSTTLFVLFCFLFIYLLLLLLFFFYFYEKTNTRVAIIMHYNNDSKASNSPLITYSLLPKFTTSLIILLTKQFLFVYRAHSIVQPYFSRAYVTRCDLVVDNFPFFSGLSDYRMPKWRLLRVLFS